MFGHALNNIIDSPRLSEVPASIIEVQKIVYSFHMPLFFFLSGIFAWQSVSKYDFFSSIKDKIRRLLVPYAFWSFMLAFVKVLFPAYQNHPETWDDFLYSWKNMHGIYWYLYILFLFFLMFSGKPCQDPVTDNCILNKKRGIFRDPFLLFSNPSIYDVFDYCFADR